MVVSNSFGKLIAAFSGKNLPPLLCKTGVVLPQEAVCEQQMADFPGQAGVGLGSFRPGEVNTSPGTLALTAVGSTAASLRPCSATVIYVLSQ